MSWLSFSCITWTKDLSVIHLFQHQIAKKNWMREKTGAHFIPSSLSKWSYCDMNAMLFDACAHTMPCMALYMWLFRFLLRCGWVMKKSWSFLRCNLEIRCDIETCYIFVFASLHSWSAEQSTMWGILMMPTLYLFVFWCVRLNVLVYIFVVFLRLPFSCLCCTHTSTHPKTDAVVVHNGFVIPTFVVKVCYAYVDPISLHGFTTVNNIVLFSLFCCFIFWQTIFHTHTPAITLRNCICFQLWRRCMLCWYDTLVGHSPSETLCAFIEWTIELIVWNAWLKYNSLIDKVENTERTKRGSTNMKYEINNDRNMQSYAMLSWYHIAVIGMSGISTEYIFPSLWHPCECEWIMNFAHSNSLQLFISFHKSFKTLEIFMTCEKLNEWWQDSQNFLIKNKAAPVNGVSCHNEYSQFFVVFTHSSIVLRNDLIVYAKSKER